MIKIYFKIAAIYFVSLSTPSFGQCSINELFPFKHGLSKFEVIKQSKSIERFVESKSNEFDRGRFEYIYYLNDSVFQDRYNFDIHYLKCFKSSECTYQTYFADDKLYKQIIEIEFSPENYDICYNTYKSISDVLKRTYLYTNELEVSDPDTKAKKGEGYSFSNFPEFNPKVQEVDIIIKIIYGWNWNTSKPNNVIDKYLITITSVDLSETQLDNRKY